MAPPKCCKHPPALLSPETGFKLPALQLLSPVCCSLASANTVGSAGCICAERSHVAGNEPSRGQTWARTCDSSSVGHSTWSNLESNNALSMSSRYTELCSNATSASLVTAESYITFSIAQKSENKIDRPDCKCKTQ